MARSAGTPVGSPERAPRNLRVVAAVAGSVVGIALILFALPGLVSLLTPSPVGVAPIDEQRGSTGTSDELTTPAATGSRVLLYDGESPSATSPARPARADGGQDHGATDAAGAVTGAALGGTSRTSLIDSISSPPPSSGAQAFVTESQRAPAQSAAPSAGTGATPPPASPSPKEDPTPPPDPDPTEPPPTAPTPTPTPDPDPTEPPAGTPSPTPALAECSDGVDNDGDLFADTGTILGLLADPECSGPDDSSEAS